MGPVLGSVLEHFSDFSVPYHMIFPSVSHLILKCLKASKILYLCTLFLRTTSDSRQYRFFQQASFHFLTQLTSTHSKMNVSKTSSSTRSVNSGTSSDGDSGRGGDMAPDSGGPRFRRSVSCNDADGADAARHVTGSRTAKYVQGSVGMIRATKNFATRMIYGQRDGVIVINLDDGGSLSFYKVRFCLL